MRRREVLEAAGLAHSASGNSEIRSVGHVCAADCRNEGENPEHDRGKQHDNSDDRPDEEERHQDRDHRDPQIEGEPEADQVGGRPRAGFARRGLRAAVGNLFRHLRGEHSRPWWLASFNRFELSGPRSRSMPREDTNAGCGRMDRAWS